MANDSTTFTIYQEEFWGGYTEALEQNSNVFNAASNNAIVLTPRSHIGQYSKETFFKTISNLVTRRTPGVAAASDLDLTQGENVRVKLDRKIGPVLKTLDALRKIGSNQSEMSFLLGQQIGAAVAIDYVNTAIGAAAAAMGNNSGVTYTAPATTNIDHTQLVNVMAKFGDAGQNVVAWVMHSSLFYELVKSAIADKIDSVAGVTIYSGTVATFGRPVIVTDSDNLWAAGTPNTYKVMGLVESAIRVEESEGQEIVDDLVTGLQNLAVRIQGEYAYTLGILGYAWDVANGGANPDGTAVLTGTNWDKVVTDNKSTAGVIGVGFDITA